MLDLFDLRERVVIVTGGASGMGEAAVRMLAQAGARPTVFDVDDARLQAVGGELGVPAFRVDVSRAAEVAEGVARVEREHGRIDGLLHFAGILDAHQLDQLTEDIWQRVVDINLKGTFLTVQAVVRAMRPGRTGRIVLVSSDSARAGSSVSGPAYAASKGGVVALTRTLAKTLGREGINVNGICPGLTLSPMSRAFDPEVVRDAVQHTPLGRLAESGDIAGVAVFLLTDAARFITGEMVEVNGGLFFD